MLYLHMSNQVETLVAELIRTLEAQRESGAVDVLTPTRLIVPNLQVETFLKFSLARRTGIAANLQCQFLRNFLASLLPETLEPVRLLDRTTLQSLILSVLGRDEVRGDPAMQSVRDYLDAAGTHADDIDVRRFQLAAQLARVFQEYSLTRPEMIHAWEQGETVCRGLSAATETWQRAIWLALFAPGGKRDRLAAASDMRWIHVAEFGGSTPWDPETLPPQVHMFGLSYVARAFHQIFARLAQDTEMYLYTLSLFRPELTDDDIVPTLRVWGRPGRENVQLLLAAGVHEMVSHEVDPTAGGTALLHRLQQAILVGQPPLTPEGDHVAADPSWRILACPSIRREVEIIANEIWTLMLAAEANHAPERLRFHDIAIIVNAREADVYQTHITSVFKECHDIPLTFIDVPVAAESGFVEAVNCLLALPFGSFTRQDLLRVLTHPAFLCRLPEVDAEEWLTWCDQLAIVHGADREAHANTYIQRDLFNWEQGGRRLLLGTFMGGARSGETRSFELGDMAYLPQEFAQDRLANAASFALIVRSLIADARFCQTERLSLSDWAAFLSHWLTAYLDAPVERDEVYVSRCLQIVQDLESLDLDGQPVSYRIAYEFVASALENLEQHHSDYLTGGVVVSSFQPMRAIPFRVVFVAGMGEGNFPSCERDDPLDVRQSQRQVGDVSPREQELYMFLETLVSTRSRLYLSYVSRDEQTGEILQPSSAIQELMVFAGSGTIAPETLAGRVIHHPLRRYDPRYFPDLFPPHEGETHLTNVMPAARREAQAVALRNDLQRFCQTHGRATPSLHDLQTELEAEPWERLQDHLSLIPPADAPAGLLSTMGIGDTLALSLTHLRQFLYCPLQAWARWRLGLREDDSDDILSREDEPFDTPRLLATVLLREIFFEKLVCDARDGDNTPFADLYDRQAAHAELVGTLPTGIFLEAERHKHLRLLENWQTNLHQANFGAFAAPQVIRLGRADEHAAVDAVLEPIVLEVELPHSGQSARALQVELHGRTEAVSQTLPGSLTLVTSQTPQDRDILRGFFDQVVLSAATNMPSVPYHGIVNAADTLQATAFGPISQAEATTYLQELVSDLLGAPHPYLLPVEAVLRFQHPRNDRSLPDIVQTLRDNPRSHYSSRYGPVPFPERYAAPSQVDAERMMARRFGLFFEKQMTA